MKNLIKASDPQTAIAIEVIELIKRTFDKGRDFRAKTFFDTFDTSYSTMRLAEIQEFKKYVESEEGQRITANFVIAVSMTPSSIVNAALALLYAKDFEFNFSLSQIERCVSAIEGLTDRKVNFLVNLNLIKALKKESLYPTYVVNQNNFEIIEPYADLDELFIYISDFQTRGLVMVDPERPNTAGFADKFKKIEWSITFCISPTQSSYIALLRKAKELLSFP